MGGNTCRPHLRYDNEMVAMFAEALANEEPNARRLNFVPEMVGLGPPTWNPQAQKMRLSKKTAVIEKPC